MNRELRLTRAKESEISQGNKSFKQNPWQKKKREKKKKQEWEERTLKKSILNVH